jgi:anti-anti-sigma factor
LAVSNQPGRAEQKMEISTKQQGVCDIVTVKGRVDSATAPKFADVLEALAGENRRKIILDLKDLEYMASAGFRALLAAQKENKKHGGEVILVAVPAFIQEALEIIGMQQLFKRFDNAQDALTNF